MLMRDGAPCDDESKRGSEIFETEILLREALDAGDPDPGVLRRIQLKTLAYYVTGARYAFRGSKGEKEAGALTDRLRQQEVSK